MRGGDLLILAARPGVGKTSFALNVATNAAKAGAAVALFSLEMGANQLVQRILCAEARVNLGQLRAGNLQEGDWNAIMNAAATLSGLELYIDDTPGLSLLEMRAKARRQLRDKKKGLIIVDYLQLMQPPSNRRDGNRAVEVAEISRGLKVLAKEMDMPLLALSQLSRAVEMRGSKRPMLSDLRESGSIEQDADIVMFIDRSMDEMRPRPTAAPIGEPPNLSLPSTVTAPPAISPCRSTLNTLSSATISTHPKYRVTPFYERRNDSTLRRLLAARFGLMPRLAYRSTLRHGNARIALAGSLAR